MGKRRAPVERNSFSQLALTRLKAGIGPGSSHPEQSPGIPPEYRHHLILAETQLAAIANLVLVVADRKSAWETNSSRCRRRPVQRRQFPRTCVSGSWYVNSSGIQRIHWLDPEVSTCTFPQDHMRCSKFPYVPATKVGDDEWNRGEVTRYVVEH